MSKLIVKVTHSHIPTFNHTLTAWFSSRPRFHGPRRWWRWASSHPWWRWWGWHHPAVWRPRKSTKWRRVRGKAGWWRAMLLIAARLLAMFGSRVVWRFGFPALCCARGPVLHVGLFTPTLTPALLVPVFARESLALGSGRSISPRKWPF